MTKTCVWIYDDIDDFWSTGCGEAFKLSDGTPKDNGMVFCYHCGHRLDARDPIPSPIEEEDEE